MSEPTPRNIIDVIGRVKSELPEKHEVVAALDDLENSIRYRAPEQTTRNWIELCMILSDSLPNLEDPECPEWANKIGRIVRNEE